jgi:outer membrane immunogenic protein
MKKLMIGTAMSLAMVAGASAADLPRPAPAPVYTKAPPAAWTWTGCYGGGNVGGGWTDMSFFDPTLGLDHGTANGAGIVGGGQVGCDYQAGSFVFGIQGMFDGTGIKGSGQSPTGLIANSSTIPWLATLTGRIGFTVLPTTLIYAKGGAAWVRDELTETTAATSSASNYTASGWTAGGGLEHMFMPHWSVFIEYDYLGFGTRTSAFTALPAGPTFPINTTQNVQMGLVGVNFRF